MIKEVIEKKLKKNSDDRAYHWTFEIYPESMPDNAFEIMQSWHTPVVISPLHDKDIDINGLPKKAHYHIIVSFENKKSYSQIQDLIKELNGPRPFIVLNKRGLVRYFIHLDNPEKYQYNIQDIKTFSYADLEEYFTLSYTDKNLMFASLIDIINEFDFTEFVDFVNWARENRPNDILPLITIGGGCVFVKSFLQSRYYKRHKEEENSSAYDKGFQDGKQFYENGLDK